MVEGKKPVLSCRGASTLGIISGATLYPNIHLLVPGFYSPSEPAFLISPSLLCRKQISQTAALVPLLWPYFFVFLKPSYRMDTIGWPEHGKANPFPLTLQSGMPVTDFICGGIYLLTLVLGSNLVIVFTILPAEPFLQPLPSLQKGGAGT